MDTFRLVRPAEIAAALAAGAVTAGISLAFNEWLLRVEHVPFAIVSGAPAPVGEEVLKGALIVGLIVTGRVAFLVDAAIEGFAIGTGFALIENLWYLHSLPDTTLTLWLVRGFGTAVLQGATTTIFAVMSRSLA